VDLGLTIHMAYGQQRTGQEMQAAPAETAAITGRGPQQLMRNQRRFGPQQSPRPTVRNTVTNNNPTHLLIMRRFGVAFSSVGRPLVRGRHLVRWGSNSEHPLQAADYGRLLAGFRKQNNSKDAVKLLNNIPAHVRNTSHFNATIDACGTDPKNWARTVSIIDSMMKDDELPQPDQATYQKTIVACGRAGQWEKALELLNQMQEQPVGGKPGLDTWNATISACAKAGKWRVALTLLESMERSSEHPSPDIYTINSVISACARGKEVNTALELLSSMRGGADGGADGGAAGAGSTSVAVLRFQKVHADIISFNSAMSACAKSGQWRKAVSLLSHLENSAEGNRAPNSPPPLLHCCTASCA
jgi:pentatricopeptide repeat protein